MDEDENLLADDADEPSVTLVEGIALTPEEVAARSAGGTLGEIDNRAELLRAERARMTEERLGTTGQIRAGLEGAAAGLTYGASRFLTAGDDIAAHEELERQQTFAGTALAGEIGGALLGGLPSGGVGLSGTAARLTPRGLASANAARWISGAGSRAGAIGRAVAWESGEGAAEMALNYLAQRSLERGDVKAEDVARAALRGGAIGLASGVLSGALTKLPGPAAASVADEAVEAAAPVVRAGDDFADVTKVQRPGPASEVTEVVDETPGAVFSRRRAQLGEDDVVSSANLAGQKATVRSWEAHQALMGEIRSRGRRDLLAEIDEVMASPGVRFGLDDVERQALERGLVARARDAGTAAVDATDWAKRYRSKFRGVKGDLTYQKALRKVPKELDGEGADRLAALDDAIDGFDAELAAIRNAAAEADAMAMAGAEATVSAAPAIGTRIKDAVQAARASSAGEALAKMAGGAEVANQLGLPMPTVSQALGGGALGKAVGLFLEANAARGAVNKLLPGLIGATPLARAVSLAAEHRTRIAGVIQAGVRAAAAPARRIVAKSPKITAKVWDRTQAMEMREVAARTAAALPAPIAEQVVAQAERVTAYLDKHVPVNPLAGADLPGAKSWKPDDHAVSDWDRRTRAALDPEHAIDAVFRDPFASLEVEALRAVHPDLFAETQAALAALTASEIAKIRPAMREALGRSFSVQLTVGQLPGYLAPVQPAAQPTPNPTFGQPSVAGSSPLVTGEAVRA
jgi:hypothetical protein